MNKFYWIAPLVALLAFGALHWQFRRDFDDREAAREHAVQAAREAELREAAAAREAAIKDALAAQAHRKEERAAEEARREAEREERRLLVEARDAAHLDREKAAREVARLQAGLAAARETLARTRKEADTLRSERDFLQTFLAQARSNLGRLERLLDRLTVSAGYPLSTCVVSGKPLGSMGTPYTLVHREENRPPRTVLFCCAACLPDFTKAPARHLAKIDEAAARRPAAPKS